MKETLKTGQYLAECFWPGVSQDELDGLDTRARESAATTSGTDIEVRYLGSMLMPEDEVVFCFFDGPSADAVRDVAERAGIPYARIVKSKRIAAKRGNSGTNQQEKEHRAEGDKTHN
jgi:hypothetical protein